MFEIVTVEKLVFGGYGLCRSDKGVVFVPDVLPGERIRITPEKKKHQYTTARVKEIVEPSMERRPMPCIWAHRCGGCDWMHIQYKFQPELKKEIFLDCMERIGKLKNEIDPEVFDSPEFNYRIRAQIKADKSGKTGFFEKGTKNMIAVDNCLLLSERINSLLKSTEVSDFVKRNRINCLKVIEGENVLASDPQIPDITEKSTVINVGNNRFEIGGDSFFQSNRFLLEKLATWAKPYVGGETCVDLYGGTGFFSVILAPSFKKGILIESVSDQVEAATKNFRINGISHFCAVNICAEQTGHVINESPDLLIVDPPRPGLTRSVRQMISQLKPKKLLYVSCNPSTQARDANFFVNKAGYHITKTALFDLYPDTHHMETVVLFEK